MIRFLRKFMRVDWRYMLVELVLIVVGILLAINLNTWSADRKLKTETKISINKLAEELQFNLEELRKVTEINTDLSDFVGNLAEVGESQAGTLRATDDEFQEIRKQYGSYFRLIDSSQVNVDTFDYSLQVYYQIEYAELNDIAWQTAQISNAINAYDYDCLKEIIAVYSFQKLFSDVQNKFLDYEFLEDYRKFQATFQLYQRMSGELLERYEDLEQGIQNCR